MDSLLINGGRQLKGEIQVSGSKNAALALMTCCLLTDQAVILYNIPNLTDTTTMRSLLERHGGVINKVKNDEGNAGWSFDCSKVNNYTASYDIVRKMRASVWVLAPLLARFGQAQVSLPGGCAIGARQVDLHLQLLEAMGAKIEVKNGYIHAANRGKLKGVDFTFSKISVGATINAIMAATLASGFTTLSNCAHEPEIVDLCNCLISMGALIEGVGTDYLKITGKSYLNGTSYQVMADRIEAGTYMIAAAITQGDICIYGIKPYLVEDLSDKLKAAGIEVFSLDNSVRVKYKGERLKPVAIQTRPYPGFPTDLQAQFMALMTLCDGEAVIVENIFENRFMHVPELCRMGANIIVNGNRAVVGGVNYLSGAEVMASDLRASVSLVLAGLAANGQTKVRRAYHLDRGYHGLEEKLNNCGAQIIRITGDTI